MIIHFPAAIVPAPDALPLPAPAGLIFVLLQLTFLAHLLAMNALLGGLIITLVARLRGRADDDPWTQLANTIAGVSPSLVAVTVNFGVAPLLFLQTILGQFFFTSSIVMGWGWFSIFIVLIVAYYSTYLQYFKGKRLGKLRNPLLALTVLLFLWVGFMFTNNTTLMLNVQKWSQLYFADARGLHLNLTDPQLWPRYLHMVSGAIAVAGLMLAGWAQFRHNRTLGIPDPHNEFMSQVGLSTFTWLTLTNTLLGVWYFLALPSTVRKLFMGGDPGASTMFGIGFVLAVGMILLGFFAIRRGIKSRLRVLGFMTLVQMIVMITMRDIVRNGFLGEYYKPEGFAVQTQWLNLIIFAALLVGGILTVVWMVRKLYVSWDSTSP